MAVETERKFLLRNNDWRVLVSSQKTMRQGYLNSQPERTVRVRISNDKAVITIKSKPEGLSRAEYEYDIPLKDAQEMIELCENPIIEKTRHLVTYEGKLWEIDEFDGDNKGLTVAEIELLSEEERVSLPTWVGNEVSYDRKYFNAALIKYPYCQWTTEEKQTT